MDTRTVLNGVTYGKALRLSNKARQSTSTGELVTLLSNDAEHLPNMALSIHVPWSTTLFLIVAVTLLVRLLGPPALAGILLLVLMIPVQGFLAAKQMGLQRAQMKQTQYRVKVINEVLQVCIIHVQAVLLRDSTWEERWGVAWCFFFSFSLEFCHDENTKKMHGILSYVV